MKRKDEHQSGGPIAEMLFDCEISPISEVSEPSLRSTGLIDQIVYQQTKQEGLMKMMARCAKDGAPAIKRHDEEEEKVGHFGPVTEIEDQDLQSPEA